MVKLIAVMMLAGSVAGAERGHEVGDEAGVADRRPAGVSAGRRGIDETPGKVVPARKDNRRKFGKVLSIEHESGQITVLDKSTRKKSAFVAGQETKITKGGFFEPTELSDIKPGDHIHFVLRGGFAQSIHVNVYPTKRQAKKRTRRHAPPMREEMDEDPALVGSESDEAAEQKQEAVTDEYPESSETEFEETEPEPTEAGEAEADETQGEYVGGEEGESPEELPVLEEGDAGDAYPRDTESEDE
ncbi:MAG: hypothetical protein ABII00_12665 [Elusimicrobiota bacterium]